MDRIDLFDAEAELNCAADIDGDVNEKFVVVVDLECAVEPEVVLSAFNDVLGALTTWMSAGCDEGIVGADTDFSSEDRECSLLGLLLFACVSDFEV